LKALRRPEIVRAARFRILGPKRFFYPYAGDADRALLERESEFEGGSGGAADSSFVEPPGICDLAPSGAHEVNREAGLVSGQAIEAAIDQARAGQVDAIVTAPICKAALNLAGFHYPGHTEFLAQRFGSRVVMMMVAGPLRVALATTHCALSEVPLRLNEEVITRSLAITHAALSENFGIADPSVAVCALNPHAGEGGLLGVEEKEIISPAVEKAVQQGMRVAGPFPADSLFAAARKPRYDAYLAMYHDQGLIPLKMVAFGRAVNFTAGLPVVRTSPDHGTAFDIAGKNRADSRSMEEAVKLAIELVSKRRDR